MTGKIISLWFFRPFIIFNVKNECSVPRRKALLWFAKLIHALNVNWDGKCFANRQYGFQVPGMQQEHLNINLIFKCYCGYFYSNSGGFITMFFKVRAKFPHNLAPQLPVLSMGTMCSPTKKGKAKTILSGFVT